MSRFILAVCDDSPDYINRFLSFFRKSMSFPFEIIGFTSLKSLEDYIDSGDIDILLLSQDLSVGEQEIYTKGEKGSVKVRKLIFLGEQQDLRGEPGYIDRYRSMNEIKKDIQTVVQEMLGSSDGCNAKITGIYSMDPDCDIAALTNYIKDEDENFGERPGKTLLIDLDVFSGLSIRSGRDNGITMTDLIFYYQTDRNMFLKNLDRAVCQIRDMYMLCAPTSLKDLDEISGYGWQDFLDAVAAHGSYTSLIINVTDSCRDLISLFSICDDIYIAGAPSSGKKNTQKQIPRQARMQAIRNYFSARSRDDISDRFKSAPELSVISDLTPYTYIERRGYIHDFT